MHPGRIAVIGDQEAVMGLSMIGLEGHAVATLPEARQALERALRDPAIGLILLTENWGEPLQGLVADSVLSAGGPMIVEIPSAGSVGVSTVHERIERSLGIYPGE